MSLLEYIFYVVFLIILLIKKGLTHAHFRILFARTHTRATAHRTCTGKSLSEALIFAQHGENMLCTEIVGDIQNNLCTQHVLLMLCKNKSF